MDSVEMLISGIIRKNNQKMVRVSFLRGDDLAEGCVPDGKLTVCEGFNEEEKEQLERYLRDNAADILIQAGKINPIKNMLGMK